MAYNPKIAFIQPRLDARDFFSINKKEQLWVPWGLVYLKSIAESMNFETSFFDRRINNNTSLIFDNLRKGDILAISVMTGYSIKDSLVLSEEAQSRGIKVIWGGPHTSLYPLETLNCCCCDAVLPGIGFGPFRSFLTYIQEYGWPKVNIPGVFIDVSEDYIPLSYSMNLTSIEKLVYLSLDGIKWSSYINNDISISKRTINFNTSEGCCCSCTFCSEPTLSKRRRFQYPETKCISWLKNVVDHSNATGIKLFDPNYFQNYNRALQIVDSLHEYGLTWAASMHPLTLQNLKQDDLDKLSELGFRRLLVGLESPNFQIIELCKKGYNPDNIYSMAEKLKKSCICGMFTFIVGWPEVDLRHITETIECARSIQKIWGKHQSKIHFLEYWPGTPFFSESVKQYNYPEDWVEMNYYSQSKRIPTKYHEMVSLVNKELSPYVDA